MGDVKNLYNEEAVEKIKDLVKSADICLFTTALSRLPLTTRPMSTQDVDDKGALWFLSPKSSGKNLEILQDSRVQLFYFNKSSSEYLSIYGEAEITTDKEKIKQYWTTMAKAWFTEGEDDPEISVIKVTPQDAYYWDTKHNKMVATLKIAAAVITGNTMDDGVEGTLHV